MNKQQLLKFIGDDDFVEVSTFLNEGNSKINARNASVFCALSKFARSSFERFLAQKSVHNLILQIYKSAHKKMKFSLNWLLLCSRIKKIVLKLLNIFFGQK